MSVHSDPNPHEIHHREPTPLLSAPTLPRNGEDLERSVTSGVVRTIPLEMALSCLSTTWASRHRSLERVVYLTRLSQLCISVKLADATKEPFRDNGTARLTLHVRKKN